MSDLSIRMSEAERAAQRDVEVAAPEATGAAEQERARVFRSTDPEGVLKERKLELGWIGRIFGGKEEKAGNIAVAAIIMAFLMVVAVFMIDALMESAISYSQVVVTGGISIITAALGYVCGVDKSSNDRNPDS